MPRALTSFWILESSSRLGFGEVHAGALVVAERELEEAFLLAFEFGVGVGVGLDGLVEVLALAEFDEEVAGVFFGLLAGLADGGVGGDVAHEDEEGGFGLEVGAEVVDGAEGVVEGALGVGDGDDLRHCGCGFGDGAVDGQGWGR